VRCPHCREDFPKNDFAAFYRSGLDAQGVFDPARADRSLLYNAEHPAQDDPLRGFGVDDGEGYVAGDARWRFIGAYLIYGQWKQAVLGGIRSLSSAYLVTGDRAYAHKAGVLLDRVADLYPTFDFGKQGVMYEGPPSAGYVSTWHDACEETRSLALAFDLVRDALADDAELVGFLSARARQHGHANPKASWADIRHNIEDGILRDALVNRGRIHSNYPRTEIALATIQIVLGWPANRDDVFAILDPMLRKATAVDGVTGEKGLAGYSAFTIQGVAEFLAQIARMDAPLLDDIVRRHPSIRDMFRFHVDTWRLGRYYPQTGDTGGFARPSPNYVGAGFTAKPGVGASMFTLMVRLHRLTRDPVFAQLAYMANGRATDGLPHDLFCADPAPYRREVAAVVKRHGAVPAAASVNKEQWRLAILKSGKGADERAVWLDYDAGGAHGHADAMNLGLFACGLDLMPEFGYPPVQFGGWGSPRARWYTMTAAHNTVVVDGANQRAASGACTLWADGPTFRAVRAQCPEAAQVERYERTVAVADVGPGAAYILDVFRVRGGQEHVRFQHGHFATPAIEGVELRPEPDYGHDTQMRAFRMGPIPEQGARVVWEAEDRLKLLPDGVRVTTSQWELTADASVGVCEAWLATGGYNATEEMWLPRMAVRRRGPDLTSTFVAVIEPHAGKPAVVSARRVPIASKGDGESGMSVAVEVVRADGMRDLIVARDPERLSGPVSVGEAAVSVDGDLCRITFDGAGRVVRIAAIGCASIVTRDLRLSIADRSPRKLVELVVTPTPGGRGSRRAAPRIRVLAGADAGPAASWR
jgi:hypothetical protein